MRAAPPGTRAQCQLCRAVTGMDALVTHVGVRDAAVVVQGCEWHMRVWLRGTAVAS